MSKRLAGIDRLIIGLLAVLLIVLGAWPLLIHFGVTFAQNLEGYVDHDMWGSVSEQSWYVYVLAALAAVSLVGGLSLLVANCRPHRLGSVESPASTEDGAVTLNVAGIAGGIASHLSAQPDISKVERKVAYDRARPTVALTIIAEADADVTDLVQLIDETESDFRAALPGVDIDTTYKLHVLKVTGDYGPNTLPSDK